MLNIRSKVCIREGKRSNKDLHKFSIQSVFPHRLQYFVLILLKVKRNMEFMSNFFLKYAYIIYIFFLTISSSNLFTPDMWSIFILILDPLLHHNSIPTWIIYSSFIILPATAFILITRKTTWGRNQP